ncbi:hypothetical protein [Sideroxyarcus emersonii]|nr:hypothetical protein [Sideroxyarcus emersonii]
MSQPTNPLSAREPRNLVADGCAETTMLVFEKFADEAIAASKPYLPQPQRSVTKALPTGSTEGFWNNMIKGRAPIQIMQKGLGEALRREKEKLALAWLEETLPTLKGPLTSDAWLGGVK